MDVVDNSVRPRPLPRSRGHAAHSELVSIDSEHADAGRRAWPTALAVIVLGLVLGVLGGLAYSATEATTYQATTAISALPDPDLDQNDDNPTSQDATAFIQSQLVVVNGDQLAERVRAELALSSRPDVEATQVGQTYVISIVATASSEDEAVAVAQRTALGYDATRTSTLTATIDRLLAATNRQLSTVSGSLSASRRGSDATDPLTPSQTALQTEYERLLSQRSSLTGVRARVGDVVTVVAPARATSSGLSTTTRDLLVGGLLGVVVALAAFVVLRRSVRRIRTVADLSALGLVTILPVQSGRVLRAGSRPDTAARLLAARLDPELTAGEPLVFVGVTSGSGADQVSAAVAAALTDRGPVLYLPRPTGDTTGSSWLAGLTPDLSAADFFEMLQPSDVPGVWLPAASPADPDAYVQTRVSRTAHLASIFRQARQRGFVVVVQADALSESDMAVDCGRAGASIVLVVARGASSPADVVVATELFAAQSVSFLGAVLNEAPSPLTRLARRPGLLAPRAIAEPTGTHRSRARAGSTEQAATAPPDGVDEPGMADAGHDLLGYEDHPTDTDTDTDEVEVVDEPDEYGPDDFDTESSYGYVGYGAVASSDGRGSSDDWRFR